MQWWYPHRICNSGCWNSFFVDRIKWVGEEWNNLFNCDLEVTYGFPEYWSAMWGSKEIDGTNSQWRRWLIPFTRVWIPWLKLIIYLQNKCVKLKIRLEVLKVKVGGLLNINKHFESYIANQQKVKVTVEEQATSDIP